EACTTNSSPRYLLIVLAFAGLSTITSSRPFPVLPERFEVGASSTSGATSGLALALADRVGFLAVFLAAGAFGLARALAGLAPSSSDVAAFTDRAVLFFEAVAIGNERMRE